MSVYEKIEAQRNGKEFTDVWMVGQQLMDILRSDPSLEEIVDKDLDVAEMDLVHCAKKIKARADEIHKQSKINCVCITPDMAEGIIREFYGLPAGGTASGPSAQEEHPPAPTMAETADILDFEDFL